ncbi:prolyl 4-hydroxylase [Acrasis kona]|uniref:Prolyl 4-hydroxylase n=1 Tax=Acrasis kona TaxID=1008807 RepID=A0AAW2Z069_9EUKA
MLPLSAGIKDHPPSLMASLGRSLRKTKNRVIVLGVCSLLIILYIVFFRSPDAATAVSANVVGAVGGSIKSEGEMYDPYRNMKVLSWSPRLFYYSKFLSHKECDEVINMGKDKLERSKVVGAKSDEVIQDRSSSGYWVPYSQSKFIDDRISAVTHIEPSFMEQLHLLHYDPTQEYKPHFDWFPRNLNEHQEQQLKDHGQRYATFIIFLDDVEEGGETWFPKPDIKVKPVKGDGILFYDLLPSGEEDNEALHGGLPVIKGEKWIVTKWIRQKRWSS